MNKTEGLFVPYHASVELALYDAAVHYLNELKASGEKITPGHCQAETERLTAHNTVLYRQMTELIFTVTVPVHISILLPVPPAPKEGIQPEERKRSADENDRAA